MVVRHAGCDDGGGTGDDGGDRSGNSPQADQADPAGAAEAAAISSEIARMEVTRRFLLQQPGDHGDLLRYQARLLSNGAPGGPKALVKVAKIKAREVARKDQPLSIPLKAEKGNS